MPVVWGCILENKDDDYDDGDNDGDGFTVTNVFIVFLIVIAIDNDFYLIGRGNRPNRLRMFQKLLFCAL